MTHFTSIFFKSVEFFKNHFSCPVHKNSTDLKKIEAIFSERIAYPRPEERNQQPTTTKPTIMASFDVTMTKAMETAAQGMINEALTTRAHRGKSVALPLDRLELVRSWAEQDVETLTQSGARVVGDISELLPSAQAVDTGGPDLDDLERAAGQALALLSGLASDTKNS
jgi:hypothetical protein